MPDRKLRLVGNHARCRTKGCDFAAVTRLGFCDPCAAVYQAAHVLRERILDRESAYLHARHRVLLDALLPAIRDRLLRHMAAQKRRGRVPEAGLDDLLGELRELRPQGGLT